MTFSHKVSVTAGLIVALHCGCTPTMQNLAPQLNPIPVEAKDLQPISFKGVAFRIPVGEQIGGHHDGILKIRQYSLHWQSGISFGSEEFTLAASETLRQSGYNVIGGQSLFFGGNEGAKANYQLGATITGLKYNTFGPLAGDYNEAVIFVEWQLYDAFQKQIVLRDSTEGFAKQSPISKPAVFSAFNSALRNLLAHQSFVDVLRRPSAGASGPSVESIPIVVGASSVTSILPEQINEILTSVITVQVGSTIGSGFLITDDGYVLTAAHVVAGVNEANITFNSKLTLAATVVRSDNHQDVALLKLPGTGYKYLSLAIDSTPSLGSEVFAIGTPFSEELSLSVTRGIVSGLRELDGLQYVQTDASLSPGYSGGPLLNKSGQVIGVVSWKIAAPGFEGLAFGVPMMAVGKCLNVDFVHPQ